MIVTVTLNPAMDRTVSLDELRLGEVNRAREARSDPGGKGINVSRVLRELGAESLAMGFVAGSIGRFIEASLNEHGIADDFIHTAGQSRTNMSIMETKFGRQTSLNEPGPTIEERNIKELRSRVQRQLRPGVWVVLAGSIPPGAPAAIYREMIALVRAHDAIAVLDADGGPLTLGVAELPHVVKPNLAELEHLVGKRLGNEKEIVAAAQQLHATGIAYVVISLGADGTVAIGPDVALRGHAPRVEALSGVGAGDSLVAGLVLCLSQKRSLEEGLRLGMAAGAATALTPGTMLCRREDVERLLPEVRIEQLAV